MSLFIGTTTDIGVAGAAALGMLAATKGRTPVVRERTIVAT